jgi:hypothetical protein
MRRWRERMEEHGHDGLTDRRKGKRSQRRVPVKTCEGVLRLYRERYFDLSTRHLHEKLKEQHSTTAAWDASAHRQCAGRDRAKGYFVHCIAIGRAISL